MWNPNWVRVGLGVMAMKRYSTLPIFPELEPHREFKDPHTKQLKFE